ncbi:hypothetical protein J3R82DRAFT_8828 [Butyriboletus roseoflavus]|nr:hypothetical protein J3R82DRAFT_8828 [Butyriboletus roseoflavus]
MRRAKVEGVNGEIMLSVAGSVRNDQVGSTITKRMKTNTSFVTYPNQHLDHICMERSAKKPRLQGPDGFQKAKPTSRYKPPESITKFVSAFDDTPSIPNKTLPPLKVLKPPVFLPPAAAPPRTTKVELTSKTAVPSLNSLRPPPKLPSVPSEKPRSILKPPPVPIPSSTKPPVPLKPLAPPPPLPEHHSASPKKHMKTILTTNVAQATDPTKEGASAELLSLFLQQHGHSFTSSTDRELQRGVMVSPDKHSRGKDPKFVRGGLAERFQHRISCAKTDFTLWRRQMEQKIESGSKFASDMQLRILKVLDVAKVSERSRFAAGPRSGLAFCRLTRRHQFTSGDLTLGTYVVLFNFAPTNGGRSAVSSADRFEEGNDVMVWLPWQKVELAGVEGSVRLLEMFRALDVLTPPHSLLVVSRFCVVAPRLVNAT